MSWAMKLLITHHTRPTSRLPTTTFLSTSPTSWMRNTLKTKVMPKWPSMNSLPPELQIFIKLEYTSSRWQRCIDANVKKFKLGHYVAETTRNVITAWGKDTNSERTTRRWFKNFLNGDTSLGDEEGRGRPSVAIIEADTRKTTREVAEELNVDQLTIVHHLTQIGKVKKLDKWVPHDLNDVHKNQLLKCRRRYFCATRTSRIVTCDEKWIFYDNRRRSSQWLNRDAA
ncbi:SETMAR [Cordylochernes scorpioides]|uniref:SETMAR n=1 Tax=Cordylochernes scorpioides TaxID=51811 RepID=A0ABY6L4B1_9ARAC|nr:SETMAR [Cordylochernes scorpioides]